MGYKAGQVKWNSREFVPDLGRFGAYVVKGRQWKFWVYLGLSCVEASVFLEILRFAL